MKLEHRNILALGRFRLKYILRKTEVKMLTHVALYSATDESKKDTFFFYNCDGHKRLEVWRLLPGTSHKLPTLAFLTSNSQTTSRLVAF